MENFFYPLSYYKNFFLSQKHGLIYSPTLHKKANYLILSPEQKRAVKKMDCIIKLSRFQRTLTILSAKAGTGKTTLLSIFADQIMKSSLHYDVISYTGRQSAALGSKTIFGFLGIYNVKCSPEEMIKFNYSPQLKEHIQKLDFLLVDECSIIGARIFQVLNKRLQLIRNNQNPFGGIHLIIALDFFQALPCMDISLSKHPDIVTCQFAKEGIMQFRAITHVLTLTKSYRQQFDSSFEEILDRMRIKQCTSDDIALLSTRVISALSETEKMKFENCPRIFTTNKAVLNYTKNKILEKFPDAKLIRPQLSTPCSTCELRYKEFLFHEDINIMLTRNIFYQQNLYNGAILKFVKAVYRSQNKEFPDFIVLKSLQYRGTPLHSLQHHFPLVPITEEIHCKHTNQRIKVAYYPLQSAHGFTVHKMQGATLNAVVIDTDGFTRYDRLFYTAASRVKAITGLCFDGTTQDLERLLPLEEK